MSSDSPDFAEKLLDFASLVLRVASATQMAQPMTDEVANRLAYRLKKIEKRLEELTPAEPEKTSLT